MRPFQILITIIFSLMVASNAFAATVKSIEVKGNRKIESAAIINKMKHKTGGTLVPSNVRRDISNIFSLGFFDDVQVSQESAAGGVKLIVTVSEKPSVSFIEYNGNSELDDDELGELTKIKPYEIVNFARLNRAIQEIQKAYEDKGYLLAKVNYKLEPVKKTASSRLVFDIEENDKVKVKRVSFIGNNKISDNELKGRLITQEGGFFSFISGSGNYKKEAFAQDLKIVNLIYFSKGYVQVKISRPEISVTPDKKHIFISIRIDEGEQFYTGDVKFAGDLLYEPEELYEAITIDDSEIFVYDKVQADLRALEAKYGDKGYAYVNPIPKTFIRAKERKVDLIYELDKGKKVYFGRIDVSGNTKTRDKVLRRELTIMEGQLFNYSKKEESIANIRRLGYFDDVQLLQKTPQGRDDLMDIEIHVKERNTGSFQLGAGYSSFSGPIFNAQLNQTNFLGYGYRVGLGIDYSDRQKRYNLNFTDPYFRDSKWSLGFDLYRDELVYDQYQRKVEGGAIRVGHPIYGRYTRGFLKYRLDKTSVGLGPTDATDVFDTSTVNGWTSSLSVSVEYDKRNDRFNPSAGMYGLASVEYAGLGGDLKYVKGNANLRYYNNLFWSVVWRNNLSYGFLAPVDGEVPFDQRFRLGGPYNLRGFRFGDVGKRAFSPIRFAALQNSALNGTALSAEDAKRLANVVFGGTQQLYYMSELEFSLVKEARIRGVLFFDTGIADDGISTSSLRSDVGFGIRWFSPLGPLRFELGYPLGRKSEFGENTSEFHFAIGAPF